MEGQLRDETNSMDEFSHIEEELVIFNNKIKNNDEIYKKKEKIEIDRFNCQEIKSFFENLNFFLKLLYSLVKIYEFKINEIRSLAKVIIENLSGLPVQRLS